MVGVTEVERATTSQAAGDGPAGRLLLVEDDRELAGMLCALFTEEGYAVQVGGDGHTGLRTALGSAFDVLVLDRRLPAVEGLDLLARLRRHGVTTPVLVLSAQGSPADRVAGLDAGAEDYLAKPFDVDELLARVRALMRRHLDRSEVLPLGGEHWLRLADREVRRRDAPGTAEPLARLSPQESALLAALAARASRVFSRAELMDRVFPDAESEIVVDTYVHYLRRKLGRSVVTTVRGRGYRLGAPSA
jgi:two-component system response regulator QseB